MCDVCCEYVYITLTSIIVGCAHTCGVCLYLWYIFLLRQSNPKTCIAQGNLELAFQIDKRPNSTAIYGKWCKCLFFESVFCLCAFVCVFFFAVPPAGWWWAAVSSGNTSFYSKIIRNRGVLVEDYNYSSVLIKMYQVYKCFFNSNVLNIKN